MFFDEFGSRNLISVSRSSMVSEAVQDDCVFVILESPPGLAVVVIDMSVQLSASRAIMRGCSFRIVGVDGANSSNPAFIF